MKCKVIIVTHNNQQHLQWLLDGLESSRTIYTIDIVDSGSENTSYLYEINSKHNISIVLQENIGFVKGNNVALKNIDNFNWILFLNPDARIEGYNLDDLLVFAETSSENIGVISVPLLRYDISNHCPTGEYDSLGIKCNFYGKWMDVTKKKNNKLYYNIDAVCGAFMLINKNVLYKSLDKSGKIGFERAYHMYKEDIELSLRIKRSGFKNIIYSKINAHHCRGWNKKRSSVPFWAKMSSAVNDVDIALRYKIRALPYALLKLLWVRTIEKRNSF